MLSLKSQINGIEPSQQYNQIEAEHLNWGHDILEKAQTPVPGLTISF